MLPLDITQIIGAINKKSKNYPEGWKISKKSKNLMFENIHILRLSGKFRVVNSMVYVECGDKILMFFFVNSKFCFSILDFFQTFD